LQSQITKVSTQYNVRPGVESIDFAV